jgi:hypothetical protein
MPKIVTTVIFNEQAVIPLDFATILLLSEKITTYLKNTRAYAK